MQFIHTTTVHFQKLLPKKNHLEDLGDTSKKNELREQHHQSLYNEVLQQTKNLKVGLVQTSSKYIVLFHKHFEITTLCSPKFACCKPTRTSRNEHVRTPYLPLLLPAWHLGAAVEHNDAILTLGLYTTSRVAHTRISFFGF